MKRLLIPPPAWALGTGAIMWWLRGVAPVPVVVARSFQPVGWGIIAAAVVVLASAMQRFRRAGTTVSPFAPEQASALVTHGLYRYTRNPMYLGLALLLTGWAIVLGKLLPFAMPPLFMILITRVQIHPEETALRERFGDEYVQYCHRVRRWFGRRGAEPGPRDCP